ncbi:hypothetical protein [Phreatobacter sp.]|uniref:hypothetical protein n=1 Tax=Phreatobacter sp. TaxID=1966341 RepID=UPI003F6EA2C7
MMSGQHRSGRQSRLAQWLNAADRIAFLVLVGGCVVAGQLVVLAELAAGGLPFLAALVCHLGLAAACGLAIRLRFREERLAVLVALWAALLGPIGAVAAIIVLGFRRPGQKLHAADSDWLDRLNGVPEPETGLLVALNEGRAFDPAPVRLDAFKEVMSLGSVSEKQTILGLIAQRYEPALFTLLMDGLRSPQVAVRASAAAVLARLRQELQAELKEAEDLARSDDHHAVARAASLFTKAASSRLLPADDAEKALLRAQSLRRKSIALDVVPLALHQGRGDLDRAASGAAVGAQEQQQVEAHPAASPRRSEPWS